MKRTPGESSLKQTRHHSRWRGIVWLQTLLVCEVNCTVSLPCFEGLLQDCSISNASTMKVWQSCTNLIVVCTVSLPCLNGSVQDCSIFSANALEILQPCAGPSSSESISLNCLSHISPISYGMDCTLWAEILTHIQCSHIIKLSDFSQTLSEIIPLLSSPKGVRYRVF